MFLILMTGNGYAIDSLGSLGTFSSGAGLTSANLDNDPRPDLIFAWIDNPAGADYVKYYIAKNVDSTYRATWEPAIAPGYSPGNETQGLGVSIGDINDNGKNDIIFVSIDNPAGDNNIRYNIGYDLNENGHITNGWSGKRIITDVHVGSETSYAGSGLWDIDQNGRPDLVVAWCDNPVAGNNFYYSVFWNLDKYGYAESIGDRREVRSGWHPDTVEGLGLELANLDDNPAPEFILSIVEDRGGDPNRSHYMTGWNLKTDGTTNQWTDWKEVAMRPGLRTSAGMGLAVDRIDNHYKQDLIYGIVDDPGGENSADFHHKADFEDLSFRGLKTNNRAETIKHSGKAVLVSLNEDKKGFSYSVMQDNEEWSEVKGIQLPDYADDESVTGLMPADAPFTYLYNTKDIETKRFHLVTDGKFLYLWRVVADGSLYADRFVLDISTNELKRPYDIRFRRSKKKCEKHGEVADDPNQEGDQSNPGFDTPGYRDMDMNEFYEPTTRINGLRPCLDFAVVIAPTSLPNEKRWQIFSLMDEGYRAIEVVSLRKARDDFYNKNPEKGPLRVYFEGLFSDQDQDIKYYSDENNTIEETVTLPGMTFNFFSAAEIGYEGRYFEHGPAAVIYSNQQECEGKIVKRGQRLKLIVPTGPDNKMVAIDYAVTGSGEIQDLKTTELKEEYTPSACDESSPAYPYKQLMHGEPAEDTPFAYESSDGFVHVLYKHGHLWSMVYDPLNNRWVQNGSDEAGKVRGGAGVFSGSESYARNPIFYYTQPLDITATAVEYGAYGYNENQKLVGYMKRAYVFVKDSNLYLINGEKTGDLEMEYIGQNLIDATLLGYIEGAPPVPKENLTEEEDYSGISSVEFSTATSVAQSYTQGQDWGFNFQMDASAFGAAMSIESSYSFLSDKSAGSESVETLSMSQSLTGEFNKETGMWDPYNVGTALIKAKKADVYALSFKGSDRVFTYKIIPIPGSEEDYLTPFVINDTYVKNGTLDGRVSNSKDESYEHLGNAEKGSYYKEEELKELEARIKNREERIKAFYNNYSSHAFQTIPALESISRRNIINEYEWTATAGARSKEVSFANSASESHGGSFSFLGMGGISMGGGIFDAYEVNVMAGAHIEKNFTKNEESSTAFELQVESDVERAGIVGHGLEPIQEEGGIRKVDHFKWKTAYLAPDESSFYDFYDRVVDPEWLQSNTAGSNRLRGARNRANKVWRTRHFVSFVSRLYDTNQ